MPPAGESPTQAQIEELRNLFIEKYEKNPPAEPFHPVDIDRVRNDTLWCQRFLEMYELDMKVSFEKLWETCIWRKEYGANDLNENNLNMEYLKEGGILVRNRDVDNVPLLIFKTRLHNKTKNINDIMRIVVYWIERAQRENHLTRLTIFFDMSGTGLANLDIDFVRRIVDTFKLYYPAALNYILVFELAWVLTAAFKVIKALLPPKAVEILKMISKKDIHMYVDKANCLSSWGGNDDYVFSFVPEERPQPQTQPQTQTQPIANKTATTINEDKKVHFANSSPTIMSDIKEFKEPNSPAENDMLRIEPADYITFTRGESNESGFAVTSIAKIPVAFKIQTTSPEKFRVRPRCGVLDAGESINIGILLKAEHQLSDTSKDKFLVMGTPAASAYCNSAEIAEMWKIKPMNSPDVEQHRLVCQYKSGSVVPSAGAGSYGNAVPGTIAGAGAGAGAGMGSSAGVVMGVGPGVCGPFPGMELGMAVGAAARVGLPSTGSAAHSTQSDIQQQTKHLADQLKVTQIIQYITLALLTLLIAGFGFLVYQEMAPETCPMKQKSHFSCRK